MKHFALLCVLFLTSSFLYAGPKRKPASSSSSSSSSEAHSETSSDSSSAENSVEEANANALAALRRDIFDGVEGQEIVSIQPFFARSEMVLLILEFSQPLQNPIFNGKKYLLVKWIQGTAKEAEINNLVRHLPNILPALGYSFTGYTLDRILGIEASIFSTLIQNINENSDDSGRRVVTKFGYLSATKKTPTTLIFMPFLKMLSLDKYLDTYLDRHADDLDGFFERVQASMETAIQGLNELGIAHGDLALRNIDVMLDEEHNIIDFGLYDFGGKACKQYENPELASESNFQIHAVLASAKSKYEKTKNVTPQSRKRKRETERVFDEKENQPNEDEISPLKFLARTTGLKLNSAKIRSRSLFNFFSCSDDSSSMPSFINQDDSRTLLEAPSLDQNVQRGTTFSEFFGHENSNEFFSAERFPSIGGESSNSGLAYSEKEEGGETTEECEEDENDPKGKEEDKEKSAESKKSKRLKFSVHRS